MKRNQCVKCGNPLSATDKFCTECSYVVKPEELSYSSRKFLKWTGYVGLGFVVFLFFGVPFLLSQKTQTPAKPVIYATSTSVPPTASPIPTSTPTEAEQKNREMLQRAGEIYREKKERDLRATAIAEGATVTITGLVIPATATATATPTASVYIGDTTQAPSQNDYAPPYLMSDEENKLVEQIVIEYILRNCHKNSLYATNLEWVSSEGLIFNPNTNIHVRVGEMAFDRAEPQFFPKWAVEIATSNVTYISEPTNAEGRDYSTAYQYKRFCKDSW